MLPHVKQNYSTLTSTVSDARDPRQTITAKLLREVESLDDTPGSHSAVRIPLRKDTRQAARTAAASGICDLAKAQSIRKAGGSYDLPF